MLEVENEENLSKLGLSNSVHKSKVQSDDRPYRLHQIIHCNFLLKIMFSEPMRIILQSKVIIMTLITLLFENIHQSIFCNISELLSYDN